MANLRVDKITSTETFETTGSVQFNHNDDNYLSGTITAIGTQDFTIECWVYLLANRSAHQRIFGNEDGAFDSNTLNMRFTPNTTIEMYYGPSPGNVTSDTLSESRWYHIAMSYSDNVARCYVDGKEFGRIYGNYDLGNTTMFIGGTYTVGGENFNGHVSNARLIVGKGIYPENFKPPMRELEVTPETVLLACQSKTDKLEERSGNTTLSATGILHSASELTPGLLTPVPKAGAGSAITGSVEFDGNGDYLQFNGSTAPNPIDFGTGDFTVEAFVYHLGGTDDTIISDASGWTFTYGVGGELRFYMANGDNIVDANTNFLSNQWVHVAVVRNSGTLVFYQNGTAVGSHSYSHDISANGSATQIGKYHSGTVQNWKGFISNLRVVQGTALYTEDFIPPTRELKKVPNTVLLCCQDPDNPLTEATGKTITGYGDLNQSYGTDLVTNGQFTADSDWTKGTQWTISGGSASITDSPDRGSDSLLTQDASSWIQAGQVYRVAVDWSFSSGDFDVRLGGDSTYTEFSIESSQSSPYFFNIRAGATNDNLEIIANQHAVGDINSIHVEHIPPSKAGSNFTPQVGDDRKVTFEGVTKVNSDAYFYLPTGNTESRDSGGGVRGVFVRGQSDTPADTLLQTIEYINISSTGNAIDFGDAATEVGTVGACSDSTRGIQGGGQTPSSPSVTADILKLTIASTGTAVDSGADLLSAANYVEALSSSTRAVFVGGSPPGSDVLQFTEIQSLGNTVDFGDLNNSVFGEGTCCDGVRGVVFGGTTGPTSGARIDNIDYITVSSKGDAHDFGNLGAARAQGSGFSNKIRGIYAGGRYQPQNNIIEYVTIATTGDAKDFGDLISQASRDGGGTCSSTRGVHAGGDANPSPTADVNTIQYITIMSMGNAFDFGDLTERKTHIGACSNGHGGLG